MSHSNSSLNCFANCMSKYNHAYILNSPMCKPVSPHLTFGVMAHDTLYKAGKLRDDVLDGVVNDNDYYSVIPSEVLYEDLKSNFNITSWQKYFVPIIKQTSEYESELVKELSSDGYVQIEREVKLQITPDDCKKLGYVVKQPMVGIIDCLIYTEKSAVILDYKFSSTRKEQEDFDMNSQLPLYAMLVNEVYGIPLNNIRYGYIDIPKQQFNMPAILTNGTLSRAKSQNVSQQMYAKAVIAVHGDDAYYNCEPGGYYYDIWCSLALNKCAYLSIQYLDMNVFKHVTFDLLRAAEMIDYMVDNKLPFLRKYDAYTCKGCEYLESCKPWLGLGGDCYE